jgi:hypothetical protein
MVANALLIALALSQPQAESVDISSWKASAHGLTDGKGHYFVYDSEKPYETIYYGDEKRLVQLRIFGGGRNGTESWSANLWDPRIPRMGGGSALVSMKDSGRFFTATCGQRETALTEMSAEATAKLLASATFGPPPFDRSPERLLRDDRGNYYLVDRLRTPDRLDRRDFRLFVGPRGKMKQVPLKDIVDDSEGMIFSTKNGELRLVFGSSGGDSASSKEKYRWIEGKKTVALTDVDLDLPINWRLVFMDLGPYLGMRLGTPCDDLM